MRFTSLLLSTAFLTLAACQGGENEKRINPSAGATSYITLRATTSIETPAPIMAATFVPNSVASWLGHIILLDNTGKLHRVTTNSAETEMVALGKYSDVIGLSREKQSGAFLALTPQGNIKAFVQTDDEGNFGPMAVSQGGENFERFCTASKPNDAVIWAQTTSKESQKLSFEIFEDTSITLTQLDISAGETDPCGVSNALMLTEAFAVKANESDPLLTLISDEETLSVTITNGLSIEGIKNPGFVTVTSANMGSVFSEGVVLVAEDNENRVVLLSRDYVSKELKER